jgi:CHAD domain-containing protein
VPSLEALLLAERDHGVAHEYDTLDRDLERLGMTIARLPSEAGVVWRLTLPRGERHEAWEPGTTGLSPPAEIMRLVGGVLAGKELVPSAPLSTDAGFVRLRELIEAQRRSLLAHDPGVRLDADPENLHQHRVAARRARAFLRATRDYVDPGWRRGLAEPLRLLGVATGPLRDIDVLLEYLQPELHLLGEADQAGAAGLVAALVDARREAQARVQEALDDERYRLVLARLRLPPRLRPSVDSVPLDRVARTQFRALARRVDRLGKSPDHAAIHRLRIALKRARYAAELWAPAETTGRAFLEAAKTLQSLLGEHQDSVAAETLLRSSTVVDAPTARAFAAGRIAERQVARRARVMEQLPTAWRRLRKRGARL